MHTHLSHIEPANDGRTADEIAAESARLTALLADYRASADYVPAPPLTDRQIERLRHLMN